MKKLLIILVMCFASFQVFSLANGVLIGTPVLLSFHEPFNPIGSGHPIPKSPIQVPTVSLDDHTLYIYDVAYDLTLALVDEDDEVVYTVFVPANTSSVVLPSWLEGDYQLLLIPDEDYYFAGEISL